MICFQTRFRQSLALLELNCSWESVACPDISNTVDSQINHIFAFQHYLLLKIILTSAQTGIFYKKFTITNWKKGLKNVPKLGHEFHDLNVLEDKMTRQFFAAKINDLALWCYTTYFL